MGLRCSPTPAAPRFPPTRACTRPLPVPGTAEDPAPCTPRSREANLHACLEQSPVCGARRGGLLRDPGPWPEKDGGLLGPQGPHLTPPFTAVLRGLQTWRGLCHLCREGWAAGHNIQATSLRHPRPRLSPGDRAAAAYPGAGGHLCPCSAAVPLCASTSNFQSPEGPRGPPGRAPWWAGPSTVSS